MSERNVVRHSFFLVDQTYKDIPRNQYKNIRIFILDFVLSQLLYSADIVILLEIC